MASTFASESQILHLQRTEMIRDHACGAHGMFFHGFSKSAARFCLAHHSAFARCCSADP
jgi:hypothetical protein